MFLSFRRYFCSVALLLCAVIVQAEDGYSTVAQDGAVTVVQDSKPVDSSPAESSTGDSLSGEEGGVSQPQAAEKPNAPLPDAAENIVLSEPVVSMPPVTAVPLDFEGKTEPALETGSLSADFGKAEESEVAGAEVAGAEVTDGREIGPKEYATPAEKPLDATLKNDNLIKDAVERLDPIFVLLGKSIAPGTTTRLAWSPDQQFDGISSPTPVLIAHGADPGPKLCLTAAIHGDELTGIEIIRRVLYSINAKKLKGTVIGVPIVNLQGFLRGTRYLTDRRDLNRYFPGSKNGSSASRIAYSFFGQVISHCDMLVDIHTGSFYRTNLPQLRADLNNPAVLGFTESFDSIAVLHSGGAKGTLRRAATEAGIPAVTLEAGGPMELNESHVSQGVKSVNTLLNKLDMLDTMTFWGTPSPAYYRSIWVRAKKGGILFSEVKLGARVRKGDVLGRVTDPITNVASVIYSTVNGRVIGMAVNQVVLPGFGAYHLGIDPNPAQSDVAEPVTAEDDSQDIDEEEEEEAPGDSFD